MIRVIALTMLLVSSWALLATIRQWRSARSRARNGERDRRTPRLLLFLGGPVVVAVSYAAGQLVVWPSMQSLVGLVLTDTETPPLFVLQLVATAGPLALAVLVVGVLMGRWRRVLPLDGYWLANPVSIATGYLLYDVSAARTVAGEPEYLYWGATMWCMQVLLASPPYAWLFHAAAVWGERARKV